MRKRPPEPFTDDRCCGPVCPSPGWVTVWGTITEIPEDGLAYEIYLIAATVASGSELEGHENEYLVINSPGNYQYCPPTDGDKVTVVGECSILCWDEEGNVWVSTSIASPTTYTGLNLDSNVLARNFFVQVAGTQFQFRGARAGSGISITLDASGNFYTFTNTSPGSASVGEINTGANIGGGAEIFASKVGVVLNFRTLGTSTPSIIALSQTSNQVLINATLPAATGPATGSNIGTGTVPVFSGMSGFALQFHQLEPDSEDTDVFNVTLDGPNDKIDLIFHPSQGSLDLWGDAEDLYSVSALGGEFMVYNLVAGWIARQPGVTNMGTGQPILVDWNIGATANIRARNILAGSNITVTTVLNDIVITGADQTNTAANIGSGTGIFAGTSGLQLQFKSIAVTAPLTISATASTVTLGIAIPDASTTVKGLTKLSVPPAVSSNPIAVGDNDPRNTNARVPLAHAPTHQQGGSDPIKLDDLATPDDNTDLNSSTLRHGLLRKLPGSSAQFLDGNGNWSVPPSGSGATMDTYRLVDTSGGTDIRVFGEVGGVVIPFNTNIFVDASYTKVSNTQHQIDADGRYEINANAATTSGSGNPRCWIWLELSTDGGAVYTEITGSRSYADASGEKGQNATAHTPDVVVSLVDLDRIRVMASGGVGNVPQLLLAGRSSITIKKIG